MQSQHQTETADAHNDRTRIGLHKFPRPVLSRPRWASTSILKVGSVTFELCEKRFRN
jgi:hypothetical protein